ncbi:MAG: tetratricopeptide repeat protein, partial [Acidobacteriota bacterium]
MPTLHMIRPSTILLLSLVPFAATTAVPAADNAPGPSLEATYEFARGKLLADDGDFQGALEAFRRTIELDPTDPYALMEVARFHSELAQISRTRQQQLDYLEDGLDYIEQAKQLEPDNPDVLRLFAETHLRLASEHPGSLPLAQGAYERLRVQEPGDLQVLMSLAQIYLWEQRSDQAADVLQEATRYSPRNRMIHSMLVDALAKAGRASEAESSLEALVEIDPENLEVRQQLAEIRGERGDHAGAIELLESSLAMDPDPADRLAHTRLRRTLARAYHLSGRHADALREVDALQRDANAGVFQTSPATQRGGMHRLRAAILSAMTRYAEAAESFRGVVDNSGDPERRAQDALLLARLYERDG